MTALHCAQAGVDVDALRALDASGTLLFGLAAGRQHCIGELLVLWIAGFSDEMRLSLKCELTTTITCTQCQFKRKKKERLNFIILQEFGDMTISQAIDAYAAPEANDDNNLVQCECCLYAALSTMPSADVAALTKQERDALERKHVTRSIWQRQFTKWPDVLLCQLQRNGYDKTTQAFSKVRDVAIIEERIKLGDIEYELLALAYHLGEQSDSGHYTALVRRQIQQMPATLYYLDDMSSACPIRPLGTDFGSAMRAIEALPSHGDVVLLAYRKK